MGLFAAMCVNQFKNVVDMFTNLLLRIFLRLWLRAVLLVLRKNICEHNVEQFRDSVDKGVYAFVYEVDCEHGRGICWVSFGDRVPESLCEFVRESSCEPFNNLVYESVHESFYESFREYLCKPVCGCLF